MASQRIRVAAAAAAAVALLASTSACSSDGSESGGAGGGGLDVAVFASVNGGPAFAADKEGIFAEHDLDVTLQSAKTSSEMVPQLVGGKVDIALVDVATSMVAIGQGLDLVYVAGGTDGGIPKGQEEFAFANVFVGADSDIQTMADLTGKKVSIPQIKSQPWLDLRVSVDGDGGDSSKIDFIESPDWLGALKSGQVDATITSEPAGTAERSNKALRLIGPTNSGGGGTAYAYVTTAKFAKQHPEVVESFGDAIRQANTSLNADRDLLVDTVSRVTGADQAVLSGATFPVYAESPLTVEDVQFSIDYLDSYDMFEQGPPSAAKVLFQP